MDAEVAVGVEIAFLVLLFFLWLEGSGRDSR